MDALVADGIELDRHYVFKHCSPTRSAIQSGRSPYHVNTASSGADSYNPEDPVSGMQGVPRNMTGIAIKMAAAGYLTHAYGKVSPPQYPASWQVATAERRLHVCSGISEWRRRITRRAGAVTRPQ